MPTVSPTPLTFGCLHFVCRRSVSKPYYIRVGSLLSTKWNDKLHRYFVCRIYSWMFVIALFAQSHRTRFSLTTSIMLVRISSSRPRGRQLQSSISHPMRDSPETQIAVMRVSLISINAFHSYQVSVMDTPSNRMRPLGSRSISAHCAVRSDNRTTAKIPSRRSSGESGNVGHAISKADCRDVVVDIREGQIQAIMHHPFLSVEHNSYICHEKTRLFIMDSAFRAACYGVLEKTSRW